MPLQQMFVFSREEEPLNHLSLFIQYFVSRDNFRCHDGQDKEKTEHGNTYKISNIIKLQMQRMRDTSSV